MGFARGLTWRRPRLLAPARKSAAGDSRAPGVSHARAHAHPSPPPCHLRSGASGTTCRGADAQPPSPRRVTGEGAGPALGAKKVVPTPHAGLADSTSSVGRVEPVTELRPPAQGSRLPAGLPHPRPPHCRK